MIILAWESVVVYLLNETFVRTTFSQNVVFLFEKETKVMTEEIAGASFTIFPMDNAFIDIILDSLENVNTSKVWIKTDDVSTTIRGRMDHIFDVTKALFLESTKSGVHIGFQATYSIGCPGDTQGDVYLAEDSVRLNKEATNIIKQYATAKFALYPLGNHNYMDMIYDQIEQMKRELDVTHVHYATKLAGDAGKIFDCLEQAFQATIKNDSSHTVMTVTMSANSPSHNQ